MTVHLIKLVSIRNVEIHVIVSFVEAEQNVVLIDTKLSVSVLQAYRAIQSYLVKKLDASPMTIVPIERNATMLLVTVAKKNACHYVEAILVHKEPHVMLKIIKKFAPVILH